MNPRIKVTRCLAPLLWLALLGGLELTAQDKFEPLQVGEEVEVFFLNEWRPGVIKATDKQQNARVEFEFAGQNQMEDFLRAAVRRPYEAGALVPTRTYSDASGKYKIVAAIIAVSVDDVRFRRSDSTERDVPRSKLSESDQRFIQRLIKQGIPELAALPPMQAPNARTWTLRDGSTVSGVMLGLSGNKLTLELADGSQQELALNELSPGDMRFAMDSNAKKMEKEVDSMLAEKLEGQAEPAMSEEQPDIALSQPPKAGNNGRPDPAKRAQLLAEDRWEFSPDPRSEQELSRKVNLSKPEISLSLLTSRDGSKIVLVPRGREKAQLVDLDSGEARPFPSDVSEFRPAALSPSGRYLAYTSSRFASDEWFILDTENDRVIWSDWNPYGKARDVYHVEFVDEGHILTVSPRGDLGVWSLDSKELVWFTISRPLSVPALSPGGKLLYIHTNTHLLACESLTGKVLSQISSNPVGVRVLAVDPRGEKLIGLGNGQARCWDLKTGKTTQEFAVASAIMDPKFATWISPNQVAVGGLQSTPNMLIDIVDVTVGGSPYCLYAVTGSVIAAPNQRLWFNVFQGQSGYLTSPDIPTSQMEEVARTFATNPHFELRPGGKIAIELTAPPQTDRAEELKRLSELFSAAGYEVVTSGADAIFEVNIREKKQYKEMDLDQLPDDAFRPSQDLMLRVGSEIVWRATRDSYGLDPKNTWGGYVIPKSFRLSLTSAPCFALDESGNWKMAQLTRSYRTQIEQKMSLR